jgi:hypothetical protein
MKQSRISLLGATLLAAITLLPGCNNTPNLVPVVTTGTPAPSPPPFTEAPDDAAKQLATTGANTAVLLGPELQKCASLVSGYYDALSKHPMTLYRVMESGVGDWDYQSGWYMRNDNTTDSSIRAHFEDESGVPIDWDVTLDANYTPDLHPGFPSGLARVRFDYDQKLPNGGRIALTFFTALPGTRPDKLNISGSGVASVPAPLGQAAFEALDAVLPINGAVESGDIGLRSISSAETLQFVGQFNGSGLSGTAKLLRNTEQIGNVSFENNQWLVRNAGGTYPLQ